MNKLFLLLLLAGSAAGAQELPQAYLDNVKKGEAFYREKDFKNSATAYSDAFRANRWKGRQDDRYNAACSWALANVPDSAFFQLKRIVEKMNYSNLRHISNDTDLNSLHGDKRWEPLLEQIRKNKATTDVDAGYNIALLTELETILTDDQKFRAQLDETKEQYGWESKEMKKLLADMDHMDSINEKKVIDILDKHGWLGADVVGQDGNMALFLVIQHSNIKTMEKYLPMMREAVKNKKAHGSQLALLEDRVALSNHRRQLYGSQIGQDKEGKNFYVLPLEDPDNVDKRRAEMGMPPLADYLKNWNLTWDAAQYKKDLPEIEKKAWVK